MRYVLILLGLMFAGVANAIDCQTPPSCTELGYVTENDPSCATNGYVYCPFDENYKKCVDHDCEALGFTESDKTSWCTDIVHCKDNEKLTLCNCLKPRCNIGDVFYADGSCGDVQDYTEEKIAVGVVYYTNCAGGGKVINLHDLGRKSEASAFDPTDPYASYSSFYWGYYNYDIPGLSNYAQPDSLLTQVQNRDPNLYDGKRITEKILAAVEPQCNQTPGTKAYLQYCVPAAAQAAHKFYPPEVDKQNPIVGQGKWYLPAMGELMDLYGCDNTKIETLLNVSSGMTGTNKEIINKTLNALKDKGVKNATVLSETDFYWASTKYSATSSMLCRMSDGLRSRSNEHSYDPNLVRASLEF